MTSLLDTPGLKEHMLRSAPVRRVQTSYDPDAPDRCFGQFLQWIGASERTKAKYLANVTLARRRMGLEFGEITEADVGAYLAAQRKRDIRRDTFRGYYFALQCFFRDFMRLDWAIFSRPCFGPQERGYVQPVTVAEFRQVYSAIVNPIHAAAIGMMWVCGLRIGEVCLIKPSDISPDGWLTVTGKGGVSRRIPVPGQSRDYLRCLWLTHRNRDWLFPGTQSSGALSPSVLAQTWRLARSGAGLPAGVGTHSLRHGYATRLYEAHVPELVIQQVMGHKQLSTTRGYIHTTRTQGDMVLRALTA